MRVYYDTSVLVALEVGESGASELVEWRIANEASASCYSDFGRGELAAAIAKLARMGQAVPEAIVPALRHLDNSGPDWAIVPINSMDVALATDFVADVNLGLRLPDAIHIAIAVRLEAALVTLDKRQHQASIALGVPVAGPLVKI